ncbi:type II/IV secretion system ATPase subunit [Haloarcula salina]|uniref:Type II/IV secretion system ATPase subunit n=1 Tax=Haloarcula salina TaxID=1429914 RepID=A0AA41G097_9EURY|nr:type II/IV secretion system ATPase subunit [Haloarcula salina]MBV0901154.1 type II/IV secretion system ATPase subunit [Haloarcula salina]
MSNPEPPDPGDIVSDPLGHVRSWLSRTATVLSGSAVPTANYDPARHGRLVEFDGLDGYQEIERYWLNAPFAFVSINHDPERDENRYHVVEPSLSSIERELLDRLFEDIRIPLIYREDVDTDPERVLEEELEARLEEYGVVIEPETFYRLFYYLYRSFQGYGHIDPLMHDPAIEDISCDGAGLPIFVYHDRYTDIETNVTYDAAELNDFVIQLAQRSGRHISVSDPVVSTTLPDGSRIELALGEEVTPRGSAFTIRKYADEPFTPIDLLEYGTFSVEMLAYLWLAIESNKSLIFAGGTAAGKTTSMNALAMFLPPRSKVLSIEDTRELSLYHDNWLSSVTRERLDESDITMYDLLRSALRHRPEYIIVGEVRGEEAITLFQAMNTGHTTFSTMHADSVQTVINRLENEPINVPRPMVQSLDILCVQVLGRSGGERVRRAKTLAEIEGIDQRTGELDYSNTYSWRPTEDRFTESNSELLDEIRDERGWSQSELLTELRDRQRFLRYLQQQTVSDYRKFTAMVNKYYADKDRVMDSIDVDPDAVA